MAKRALLPVFTATESGCILFSFAAAKRLGCQITDWQGNKSRPGYREKRLYFQLTRYFLKNCAAHFGIFLH